MILNRFFLTVSNYGNPQMPYAPSSAWLLCPVICFAALFEVLADEPSVKAAPAAAAADKARRFSVRSFMAFDRLRESGMDLERAAFLIFGNHSKDVLDAIRVDAVSKRAPKKAS